MLDLAVDCLRVMQMLYTIQQQMKENMANCKRLCDRVHIFDEALQAMQSAETSELSSAVEASLKFLNKTLNEMHLFIKEYMNKSMSACLLRVVLNDAYAADISKFNNALNDCAQNLMVSKISKDTERDALDAKRREEDFEDLRSSMAAGIDMVLDSLSNQSDMTNANFSLLIGDIQNSTSLLEELMQKMNHSSLSIDERAKLEKDKEEQLELAKQRHEEILNKLEELEFGQQSIMLTQEMILAKIEELGLTQKANATTSKSDKDIEIEKSSFQGFIVFNKTTDILSVKVTCFNGSGSKKWYPLVPSAPETWKRSGGEGIIIRNQSTKQFIGLYCENPGNLITIKNFTPFPIPPGVELSPLTLENVIVVNNNSNKEVIQVRISNYSGGSEKWFIIQPLESETWKRNSGEIVIITRKPSIFTRNASIGLYAPICHEVNFFEFIS